MHRKFSRIAAITGATSGIGEAVARTFVEAGFGVVGNGRNQAKLKALEQELGTSFRGVPGDASEDAVLDALLAAGPEAFGRPADIVVANAGRGLGGSVRDADLAEFDKLLRVNVRGALALLQKTGQILVRMQEARYPREAADIVIIGSVVGRHISPFSAAYGASKFAVHALAESLRRDIGPRGVRVSLIEPGFVLSGFQAAAGYSDAMVQGFQDRYGPLLEPEDVARAIQFIVSQPPHVHIGDLVLRPTRQDYP